MSPNRLEKIYHVLKFEEAKTGNTVQGSTLLYNRISQNRVGWTDRNLQYEICFPPVSRVDKEIVSSRRKKGKFCHAYVHVISYLSGLQFL